MRIKPGSIRRGNIAEAFRKEGTMPSALNPPLSVAALFAECEDRRRRDREAEEQLRRKQQEELAEFKKRLDTFQLTDTHVQTLIDRIRRAFERGETELML